MTQQLPDGIYADMAEGTYHALPRLSASGVCNLLISPATFWANSWLNDERGDDDTPARILGRAAHIARLEPHRFASLYRRKFDKADMPEGALMTHEDIKAQLAALGLPATQGKEGVLGAAKRLEAAGYPGPIWHTAYERWELEDDFHDQKILLPGGAYDDIIDSSERVHQDPDISRLLKDGLPEVSVLWTWRGVQWKCRIDWLAAGWMADLKTFENSMGKNLDQCVADAVRYNRYYVQARLYWHCYEAIRRGDLALQDYTDASKAGDLVKAIQSLNTPAEWWWVFVEKKVPNVLARQFRMTLDAHPHHLYQAPDDESREEFRKKLERPSGLAMKADAEIAHAAATYTQCMEVWGTEEPWGALVPVGEIGDEDFNPHWLEQ